MRDLLETVQSEIQFTDASLVATQQLRTAHGAEQHRGSGTRSTSSFLRHVRQELRLQTQTVSSLAKGARRDCAEEEDERFSPTQLRVRDLCAQIRNPTVALEAHGEGSRHEGRLQEA